VIRIPTHTEEIKMNRFAYAQDILKNSAGSLGAGFNRRVSGMPYLTAFQHQHERGDRDMVAGWDKASEMIEAGQIFFVHNFHHLECQTGHAFLYGGTYVCNTCQRDHLEKEWWKIKVQKDGNAWCCVGNGFVDLQESDNYAFGDTRELAIQAYGELMLKLAAAPAAAGAAS
jgi:hypothetical protein